LGCGKDGFRIIQNSNSGDAEQLLRLPLLLGERVWASRLTLWLSIERERERERLEGRFLGFAGSSDLRVQCNKERRVTSE
jgi:hypothetical protein